MPPAIDPPFSFRAAVAPGLSAVRRYWRPFVLLQTAALVLVVAYFHVPAVAAACDRVSAFKAHAGLLFSAVSAAVAGAVLPEVAKALVLGDRRLSRERAWNVAFVIAIFAINGIISDFQYRGMAAVFGDDNRPATVVKKVLADQLVTTPLYGTPYWLVVYALRADRYRFWRTLPRLGPRWYFRTVTPLLVTGWAYWFPMSALLYALPGPLQFCMYLIVVAAWSLLLVAVASGAAAPPADGP